MGISIHKKPFQHLSLPKMANNNTDTNAHTNAPIFLALAPLRSNHISRSWLELTLQDINFTLNATINDQPVVLLLQDPHYLENLVKDNIDHVV